VKSDKIQPEGSKPHIVVLSAGPGWLAADKPAGLSVHNNPGADLCALLMGQLRRDPRLQACVDCDSGAFHPVHRLDKDTSGVIVMACTPEALRGLSAQLEAGLVTKRYLALVHGTLPLKQGLTQWQQWEQPLADGVGGRRNPRGTGTLRRCVTRFRVLRHTRHYSLIECMPETGRRHQIRRHAKLAGHPVVGDRRYASRRAVDYLVQHGGLQRQALHARSITFLPPGVVEPVTVRAPLPMDIRRLLATDRPAEDPLTSCCVPS
jgi:RluA family pseudouridine synthase